MESSAIAIVMVLLMGAVAGAAQEQTFSNYNCALTPPAGWTQTTNAATVSGAFTVTYAGFGRTRFLLLIVQNGQKPTAPLDSFFVAAYERGTQARGGGKPTSTRFMDIDGVKAYERVANSVIKGKSASTIRHLIITDTGIYTVEGMRFDGPVLEDSEIQQALASFRFITPVKAPALSAERAGYEFGYMLGRYGAYVALGVVAVVAGIFGITKTLRRGSSNPPPLPPQR